MKKSLTTLIFSLLLSLAFSQAGLADSRGFAVSNDPLFLQQWEKAPNLSAFLLFDNKDFALIHFPFIRAAHTIGYKDLSAYFPFLDALLSAKDLLWTEIGIQHYKPVTDTTRRAFDSNNLNAEDHMGISLNHGVGDRKTWKFSLDLGIALQNDHTFSDDAFPRLGMDTSDQGDDLFDQLRSAAPFIGFGISCTF